MAIAKELEVHAGEESQHALTIAKHIDYLGGTPPTKPLPVKLSDEAEGDAAGRSENENDTIRNYRERVQQCEAWPSSHCRRYPGDPAAEQEHQTDLATALDGTCPTCRDPAGPDARQKKKKNRLPSHKLIRSPANPGSKTTLPARGRALA